MSLKPNQPIQILGLVGRDIGYSLSPSIHNYAAKNLNINAVYLPFDLAEENLQKFLEISWQLGFVGLNVTKPYKQLVAKLIGDHSLDSVNTLYRARKSQTRSFWNVASTDAEGFANGLKKINQRLEKFKQIVFLGNGGAVKAIRVLLDDLPGNRSIHVLERKSVSQPFSATYFKDLVQGAGKETLVVQATSAPLQGDPLSTFAKVLEKNFLGTVVDLTYNCRSDLLKVAKKRGLPHQDGLPMLIEQARLAQSLWWNRSIGYQALAKHLKRFVTSKR